MEFLSDSEGGEYSTKPTYPTGKWFFYEQVLQVPYYAIFDCVALRSNRPWRPAFGVPREGALEVYRLDKSGKYKLQKPDSNGYYWIEGMKLFLGVWQGTREGRTGYWLRWWNEEGELLLWGFELVQQERQRADLERKLASEEKRRADREQLRAERLLEQLRAAGLEPENN